MPESDAVLLCLHMDAPVQPGSGSKRILARRPRGRSWALDRYDVLARMRPGKSKGARSVNCRPGTRSLIKCLGRLGIPRRPRFATTQAFTLTRSSSDPIVLVTIPSVSS